LGNKLRGGQDVFAGIRTHHKPSNFRAAKTPSISESTMWQVESQNT
jgi:hypothetical protein